MKTFPCAHPARLSAQARDIFLPRLPSSHRDASPGGLQGTGGGPARRCPQDQRAWYFFQRRRNPAESDSAPGRMLVEPKHLLSAGHRRKPQLGARWKRHIDRTAAWPISGSSQGQPSCLRAADLSAVITETLNAQFGWGINSRPDK